VANWLELNVRRSLDGAAGAVPFNGPRPRSPMPSGSLPGG
jgi:hypothetical protein